MNVLPVKHGLFIAASSSLQYPNSTSYKNYDFESNHVTANDLVQKVKLILELKTSSTRVEYLATKEKKLQKKKSFHIVK